MNVPDAIKDCEKKFTQFSEKIAESFSALIEKMLAAREKLQDLTKACEKASQKVFSIPEPSESEKNRQHEARPESELPRSMKQGK
jgi:hypothetical protein